MAKSKVMGRPRLDAEGRRTLPLQVYIKETEMALIDEARGYASRSHWVRVALLEALGLPKKPAAKPEK